MSPTTLLGLLASSPADQTAIVLPEQNLRITYGNLREQVRASPRRWPPTASAAATASAWRCRMACRRSWRFSPRRKRGRPRR